MLSVSMEEKLKLKKYYKYPMTKKFYLVIAFVLIYSCIYSQDHKFHLLISAGGNASQVNGDKLAGFDKFGLSLGAGIRRNISQKAGIQLEFLYSEKGSRDVVSPSNPIPDTLFQFNYIDIPIVYTYNVYPKLNVEIGIFNSIRTKASYSDFVNTYDRENIIRSTDHGVLGGVNYQLFENLSVNARVSQSIFDINASIDRYFNLVTCFSIRYSL